jgi:hypothetical protein
MHLERPDARGSNLDLREGCISPTEPRPWATQVDRGRDDAQLGPNCQMYCLYLTVLKAVYAVHAGCPLERRHLCSLGDGADKNPCSTACLPRPLPFGSRHVGVARCCFGLHANMCPSTQGLHGLCASFALCAMGYIQICTDFGFFFPSPTAAAPATGLFTNLGCAKNGVTTSESAGAVRHLLPSEAWAPGSHPLSATVRRRKLPDVSSHVSCTGFLGGSG